MAVTKSVVISIFCDSEITLKDGDKVSCSESIEHWGHAKVADILAENGWIKRGRLTLCKDCAAH